MKETVARHVWVWFAPYGTSARMFIGFYMIVSGLARVITGNAPIGVNVFSSRFYGTLLMIGGIALLLTVPPRYRAHWPGRIASIVCALLWILLIVNGWGAWVSISGAVVFALALTNEVRADA